MLAKKSMFEWLKIYFKYFRRGLDDQQRHAEVINKIKEIPNATVLDVGGAEAGITRFFRDINYDITLLDVDENSIKEARKNGLKAICADACKMPLPSNSFDIVISSSTLEHVPKEKRKKFLSEIKRVARKRVIIYTPCGKEAEKCDKKLLDLEKKIFGDTHYDKNTTEHLRYGLPSADILKEIFPEAEFRGIQNTKIWWIIMTWQACSKGKYVKKMKNIMLRLLFPIFLKPLNNRPPYYGVIMTWDKPLSEANIQRF
jgi:ubiquinone/menaquinone biosynthesis C-methylase UbiE